MLQAILLLILATTLTGGVGVAKAEAVHTFIIEDAHSNEICDKVAKRGDHVLLTFTSTFANGSAGPSHPQYTQPLHTVLDPQDGLPLHEAIRGMCENGTRSLRWTSLSMVHSLALHPVVGIKKHLMDDDQGFALHLHVERITEPRDYQIFEALRKVNLSQVLDLIDEHVGINAMDEYGQTPLMLAVSKQYDAVVASLLNARMPKVEVDMPKTSGFTALFYAVENGSPSILQALLRRGANPNNHILQDSSKGNTPLHYACLLSKIKHIELLLEYGADPMIKNQHGQAPLQLLPGDTVRSTKTHLLNLFRSAQAKKEKATGGVGGTGFGSPRDL